MTWTEIFQNLNVLRSVWEHLHKLIDDLHYNYTGNRPTSIVDNPNGTSNPSGYEGGGNPITYDANGNMTDMLDKGIASIAYNYSEPLKQIEVGEGNSTTTIKYTYKAD